MLFLHAPYVTQQIARRVITTIASSSSAFIHPLNLCTTTTTTHIAHYASKASLTNHLLAPGCIIEHRLAGRPCLLLLQHSIAGGRTWFALNHRGAQHLVRPQQAFLPSLGGAAWASDDPDSQPTFTLADLAAIETRAAGMGNAIARAWQQLGGGGEHHSLSVGDISSVLDLCPDAPLDLFIAYRALILDKAAHFQLVKRHPRVLFRANKHEGGNGGGDVVDGAIPPADLQRIRDALGASQGGTVVEQQPPPSQPQHQTHPLVQAIPALQSLWRFSVLPTHDVPSATQAMALLQHLDAMPTPAAGARILRQLGILTPDDPVPLFRAGMRADYPKHLLHEAAQPLQPDPLAHLRRDMTDQRVFVIDDPCTTEVDDGVAWDASTGTLYVHVADPIRALPFDSPIIKEAVARTRTVYLPGQRGKYTMLPPALSKTGGLVRDTTCCALTVAVRIDDQGALLSYQVFPSRIHPKDFLSYEASASLLPTTPELSALHAFAQKRAEYRMSKGALDLLQMEYTYSPTTMSPTPLDRTTPTRALIAETMIVANEAVARWGLEHGVALPFRTQAPPAVPLPKDATPAEVYAAVLPHLRAATVSASPAPHAGLGLTGYVQFTSPLRRVTDLLAHMQVHAVLRSDMPPFSVIKLDQVLDAIMETHRVLLRAEEQVEVAYLARFFAQQRDKVFPGTVMTFKATESGRARVLLHDHGVGVMAKLQEKVYVAGDAVELVVDAADPEVPVLTFKEVVV